MGRQTDDGNQEPRQQELQGDQGDSQNEASSVSPSMLREERMIYLVEQDLAWSPSKTWALDLLQTAMPVQEDPERKQRVRIAMTQAHTRSVRILWRQVAIVAIVVGAGAGASAAVWHWPERVADAYQRLISERMAPFAPVSQERSAPRHPSAPNRSKTSNGSKDSTIATAPTPVASMARAAAGDRVATGSRPVSRHEVVARAEIRPAAPLHAGEDTAPVLAAMRALRRGHDPVRARVLLDTYLSGHPRGSLAEEALALSIEAAVAHNDPDARALADRYLRLYPVGPFRTLARQTLATLPTP